MEPPVYLIKSRSGGTLIQGTSEQVAAWVRDQRFSSDDELKRQGWVLYENDQAWSVIEAFPEISGPSAHARLKADKRRNLWILTAAGFFALVGLILISVNFLLPAYDASRQIADSAELARQADVRSRQAVADKHSAESVAKAAVEEAETQKKHALASFNTLEEQRRKVVQLQGAINGLESQLELIKKTMPVVIRWRESLINKNQVVVITNRSDRPLKLLASIYDVTGAQTKKQYGLTLEPVGLNGSTKESGIGESIAHYFRKGEAVEFTDVDSGKTYRFNPVTSISP
jgi:hypothetical protein